LNRRQGLVVVAVVASFMVFFFVAPVVPYNNPVQLAGFFPRYVSLSCLAFDRGVAYGFGGFPANHVWHLESFCNVF
jgi:hypothetical protein